MMKKDPTQPKNQRTLHLRSHLRKLVDTEKQSTKPHQLEPIDLDSGSNPTTRRRPQALITSTPSPKNNHAARDTITNQPNKKGRPRPTPPLEHHLLSEANTHRTLDPPRPPTPLPASQQWVPEEEMRELIHEFFEMER
jgi:hypothetical protein